MPLRVTARFASFIFLTLLVVGLGALQPAPAAARSAEYDRFDVQLTVLEDGTFRIVETQTVRFEDGPFSQGHRSIPLARIAGVENIAASELVDGNLIPFTEAALIEYDTFQVKRSSTEIDIQWLFAPADDEVRTFVIEYDLVGALRYYPEIDPPNQQVWYIPIGSALTSETPVNAGTFTLIFPEPVDAASVVLMVDGEQVTELPLVTDDNQEFIFEHGGFRSGESWEIRIQTDVVALDAEVPAWQTADDERRQRAEDQANRDAQIAGFAAIGAIGLAIFGGLAIFLLWYLRGRDPHTGAVASFLPEPPDDTPPAVVGVLIDERVHPHDIVSTFTDWGRRGYLAIQESGGGSTMELLKEPEMPSRFESALKGIIFPSGAGQTVGFGNARQALKTHEKTLETALYQEVEERGYFRKSPEWTRNRWVTIATIITSLSIVGGILGSMLISSWIVLPAAVVTILSIALRLAARVLPQRTRAGAEAAAKWRAFERYLRDLEKYDSLDTAKANFERFLPYAIAFGIETEWVNRFNRAGYAPTPTWYDNTDFGEAWERIPGERRRPNRPVIVTTGGGGTQWGGGDGDFNFPDVNLPDLQDTSRKAAQGIGGASRGSVDFLNVLGAILEVVSIFAGGGGKGGGSGGGGGGFK